MKPERNRELDPIRGLMIGLAGSIPMWIMIGVVIGFILAR